MVKDYLDVFSEELESLSPKREIEFQVQLMLEANSISKTSYRMALADLKEFFDQLQGVVVFSAGILSIMN